MRSILRTIYVVLLLTGWALAAAALHVVRSPDGSISILPKNRLGVADTYVDMRNWSAADAEQHPELVRRMKEADRLDWLTSILNKPADAAITDSEDSGKRGSGEKPGRAATDPSAKPRPVLPHR